MKTNKFPRGKNPTICDLIMDLIQSISSGLLSTSPSDGFSYSDIYRKESFNFIFFSCITESTLSAYQGHSYNIKAIQLTLFHKKTTSFLPPAPSPTFIYLCQLHVVYIVHSLVEYDMKEAKKHDSLIHATCKLRRAY